MGDERDVQRHIETCAECAAELSRYRAMMTAVASLRDEWVAPPSGLVQRVVERVERPTLARRVVTVARDRRVRVAAASVGGAVVGAGAIAVIWWRRSARRGVPRTA